MTATVTLPARAGPAPAANLNDYQLRLPGFEGPLDVLLRLIEREQLPIAELSLVQVTDQFLAAMRGLGDQAPPQLIAEFATVGARLALLKSRSLLPRPPVVDDENDPGDLVQQLLRYRVFRDAAQQLAMRDTPDHGMFPAVPRVPAGVSAQPARLATYAPSVLVRVLRRRLSQIAAPGQVFGQPRVISLREMVVRLATHLAGRRSVRFSTVAGLCQDRLEVQMAFLAGLVLVRRSVADAEQVELFGEITFHAIAGVDGEYLIGLAGDVVADFDPDGPPDANAVPNAQSEPETR